MLNLHVIRSKEKSEACMWGDGRVAEPLIMNGSRLF
jgi:hypothetical protein